VDVELVAAGTLLPSVLSGRGPDVALGNASTNVMDFALRDALLPVGDLLEGELSDSFYESALIPLQLEGVQYALPETQVFPILFYRTDILAELGIKVPSTWEDLYSVLRELQKRYMDFGMPATISGYSILLYQAGGAFYKNDGRESALAEDVNVRTFRSFTNLYLNYSMPMAYDFANRFRSGEMPIGIADYTMYNQLTVFAPEISGLWNFAPMIGTVQEDGSIDRSVTGTVTGAMIMEATDAPEACKTFLRWWVGADAQAVYAREQESIMGSAARYATANRKTMEQMAWDTEQLEVLLEQWASVDAIPEVPGGYYTSRYVDFAFKDVVIQGEEVRKTLLDSVTTIDKELQYKRKEFNLD
ncbi:MAG: extracellular solute-binding protein, partial [Oscillospiraceae bacterium]|nr:extracellular solute-binding protein [Oscillospiraceae bacterium]